MLIPRLRAGTRTNEGTTMNDGGRAPAGGGMMMTITTVVSFAIDSDER